MKCGSLFSGVGGLDLAIEAFGHTVVWMSEYDPSSKKQHAAQVLEARFPGVPNLGDISQVDWSEVEPVEGLCGGFPCQDVSGAGKRAGIGKGTRSGLWFEFLRAIRALKPRWVVVENVAGLRTPIRVTDGDRELIGFRPAPLEAVLRDLAKAGFDAEWTMLRAADAGAPHGRDRFFIFAWDAMCDPRGFFDGDRREAIADPFGQPVRNRTRDVGGAQRASEGSQPQRERVRVDDSDGGSTPAHSNGRGCEGSRLHLRPARQEQAAPVSVGTTETAPDPQGERREWGGGTW